MTQADLIDSLVRGVVLGLLGGLIGGAIAFFIFVPIIVKIDKLVTDANTPRKIKNWFVGLKTKAKKLAVRLFYKGEDE